MVTSLNVRGIDVSKHQTDEYVTVLPYIPGVDEQGKKVQACIKRELHLIDNLRVNMLIENDVIGLREF